MRPAHLLLAVAVAGCQFEHGAVGDRHDGDIDAADDAPVIDPTPDTRVIPYCDPLDPDIVACYPFEDSTLDATLHHLDATMTNVSFVAGKVGNAMLFDTTSAADVGDSTLWDVGALTIEAWIKPSQLPATGTRMGILDMNGQYGFFLHETGRLQCTIVGGITAQVDAGVTTTEWSHVACTYDGATTTIYRNGSIVFQGGGGGAIATGGATGISIAADNPPNSGSRLLGLIDEVRILSRARTTAEICADAGACPPAMP
ncbi:MAG TPA: LamG domain-containing protein [Kofleriaceae bacterium]|nr:LamG domain-containing protein [Kofleriaceae bacterium]